MEDWFKNLRENPQKDPILTSFEIIQNTQFNSHLSPIPRNGGYISNDSYLSNHFHLFREDFMRDIREALFNLFHSNVFVIHNVPKYIRDTFYVYTNVLVENINFTPKEALISFNVIPSFLHQSQMSQKQLMKGSLLILTNKHFEDFQFLTVFGQPSKNDEFLKKNKRILLAANIGITSLSGEQIKDKIKAIYKLGALGDAILFEPKYYWQACSPFLTSIQQMRIERIITPFQNLIVHPENYKPYCPSFINNSTCYNIDIGIRPKIVKALGDWQNLDMGTLDKSQQKCLKHMVTHELPLIQGPPGTGKSFVGSTLVKVLLNNKEMWSPKEKNPMLILCKSNHALDTFITNISKFTQSIIRMGKRFKDPEVEKYTFFYIKNQLFEQGIEYFTDSYRQLKSFQKEVKEQYEEILEMSQDPNSLIESLPESQLIHFEHLQSRVVKDFSSYFKIKLDDDMEDTIFSMWWEGEIKKISKDRQFIQKVNKWNENQSIKYHNDDCYVEESESEEDEDDDEKNDEMQEFQDFKKDRNSSQFSWMMKPNNSSVMSCDKEVFNTIWQTNQNCFEMEYFERETIKSFFVEKSQKMYESESNLSSNLEEYKLLMNSNQEEQDQNTCKILSSRDVVCMTLNGAAMNIGVIQKLKPPIIIVEEAGEVLESILIPLLQPSLKQLILIGDHKQLKPITINYQITRKYNYDISLLERLINNKINYSSLSIQRRMRPELADYIRLIYDNYDDHDDVKTFPDVLGIQSNMYLINHNKLEV